MTYYPGICLESPRRYTKKPHSNSQYPVKTPRIHTLNENESCNILRPLLMNIWVFWDVTSCQIVNSNWHLTGTCYFQKHQYLSAIQRGTSYKTQNFKRLDSVISITICSSVMPCSLVDRRNYFQGPPPFSFLLWKCRHLILWSHWCLSTKLQSITLQGTIIFL